MILEFFFCLLQIFDNKQEIRVEINELVDSVTKRRGKVIFSSLIYH